MGSRSPRRKFSAARCDGCRLHEARCLCDLFPRIELRMRLALVMHCREVKKTTATGPLALRALPNSELFVHGLPDERVDLSHLAEDGARRLLLLFPGEDAEPLTTEFLARDVRPITLVVPDGNWRQATRAARRLPGLAEAERVTLPRGAPTEWGIRNEPRDGGLATFEAIARAIGAIESADAQSDLELFFRRHVAETKAARLGLVPGRRSDDRLR